MKHIWGLSALACVLAMPLSGARADDQAEIKALVEKAIKAHGGTELLNKYTAGSGKVQGKYYGMGDGIPFTATNHAQEPDRFRVETMMEIMGQQYTILQVYNAGKGWISVNGMTMEMPKELLDAARDQLRNERLTRLTPLRDKAYKLSPTGEIKVDGKAAVGVRAEREGYRDVSLYFDKDTAVLLKVETRVRDPMAENEQTQ